MWHMRYAAGTGSSSLHYTTTTLRASSKATAAVEEDLDAALDDILGDAFPTTDDYKTTNGASSYTGAEDDDMVRTRYM
jgi:hypothetical protein